MSKANYRQIGGPNGLLANLQAFEGNTMSADTNESAPMGLGYVTPCGREYPETRDLFREHRDTVGLQYVVWSYGTVIAWVTADGRVVIPDDKHSVTTSRQQGLVRAWMGYATALVTR